MKVGPFNNSRSFARAGCYTYGSALFVVIAPAQDSGRLRSIAIVVVCCVQANMSWAQERAVASAQPAGLLPAFTIEAYQVPEECPDQFTLIRQVDEELALTSPTSLDALSVGLVVTPKGRGLSAEIELRGSKSASKRHLEGGSCDELIGASALVIAMALDVPLTPVTGITDDTVTTVVDPTVVRDAFEEPDALPDFEFRNHRAPLSAAFELGSGAGTLPGLEKSAALWIAVYGNRFSVHFGFRNWVGGRISAEDGESGLEVGLTVAPVKVCFQMWAGWAEASACGGFEVGKIEARGFGAPRPSSQESLWLAWQVGPQVALPITKSFRLRLGAELSHASRAPSFFTVSNQIFTPDSMAVRVGLASEWSFW